MSLDFSLVFFSDKNQNEPIELPLVLDPCRGRVLGAAVVHRGQELREVGPGGPRGHPEGGQARL